jgi:hypothetical protein
MHKENNLWFCARYYRSRCSIRYLLKYWCPFCLSLCLFPCHSKNLHPKLHLMTDQDLVQFGTLLISLETMLEELCTHWELFSFFISAWWTDIGSSRFEVKIRSEVCISLANYGFFAALLSLSLQPNSTSLKIIQPRPYKLFSNCHLMFLDCKIHPGQGISFLPLEYVKRLFWIPVCIIGELIACWFLAVICCY